MKPLVIAAHSGHELLLWKWLRKDDLTSWC